MTARILQRLGSGRDSYHGPVPLWFGSRVRDVTEIPTCKCDDLIFLTGDAPRRIGSVNECVNKHYKDRQDDCKSTLTLTNLFEWTSQNDLSTYKFTTPEVNTHYTHLGISSMTL